MTVDRSLAMTIVGVVRRVPAIGHESKPALLGVKWFTLILAACLMPAYARAQVFVNQAALVQLAGFSVPAPHVAPAPAPKPVVRHVAHRLVRKLTPPTCVCAAPRPVVFKPVVPPPPTPLAPTPVPAIAKPVVPPAQKLPGPLVVGFSAGSAALPANAAAGLKPFCTAHGQTLIIDAYAPGDPSDPSSAMRLSMSRAFALRDALAACGVPGAEIIPRADGATGANMETAKIFISGASP